MQKRKQEDPLGVVYGRDEIIKVAIASRLSIADLR